MHLGKAIGCTKANGVIFFVSTYTVQERKTTAIKLTVGLSRLKIEGE